MRRYILAAVAATAIASPAAARDNSGYVGLEGGSGWSRTSTSIRILALTAPRQDFRRWPQRRSQDGLRCRPDRRLRFRHVPRSKASLATSAPASITCLSTQLFGVRAYLRLRRLASRLRLAATQRLVGDGNALVDFGGDDGVAGYVGARRRPSLGQDARRQADSGFAWQAASPASRVRRSATTSMPA